MQISFFISCFKAELQNKFYFHDTQQRENDLIIDKRFPLNLVTLNQSQNQYKEHSISN